MPVKSRLNAFIIIDLLVGYPVEDTPDESRKIVNCKLSNCKSFYYFSDVLFYDYFCS